MKRLPAVALALAAVMPAGATHAGVTFAMSSGAFRSGARIPKAYTCDGRNVSPPLGWSAPPRGTRSLALLVDDPDAPSGVFAHWIVYDLSPTRRGLPVAARPAHEGVNDAGGKGYTGPCPPSGTHRYVFRLYALDTRLRPPTPPTRARFLGLVRGHTLARATMIGRYGR